MYYSSILELFVYQISQVHWITKEFEPEINLKINILTRNVSFTACMILILWKNQQTSYWSLDQACA